MQPPSLTAFVASSPPSEVSVVESLQVDGLVPAIPRPTVIPIPAETAAVTAMATTNSSPVFHLALLLFQRPRENSTTCSVAGGGHASASSAAVRSFSGAIAIIFLPVFASADIYFSSGVAHKSSIYLSALSSENKREMLR